MINWIFGWVWRWIERGIERINPPYVYGRVKWVGPIYDPWFAESVYSKHLIDFTESKPLKFKVK